MRRGQTVYKGDRHYIRGGDRQHMRRGQTVYKGGQTLYKGGTDSICKIYFDENARYIYI